MGAATDGRSDGDDADAGADGTGAGDAREPGVGRRTVLGAAGAALVGGLAGPAAAQSGSGSASGAGVDLSGWFEGVDGVDGVTDATGQSAVEVTVGAEGNGGAFAFAPALVRVDPGTTVRWVWAGRGGAHNVVAEDGRFESDLTDAGGATFEWTAESTGAVRYVCSPHEPVGMKGAVVVGDAPVSLGGGGSASTTATTTPEATATPAGDASDGGDVRTFDGWLSNVDNYAGVVDRTGESVVEVAVGARGNGGPYAFDPPAIRVDPGTTVVWEWVGAEGPYDVLDPETGIRSEAVSGPGNRFAARFDGSGLVTYECERYGDRGMRGVVLVGDGPLRRPTPAAVAGGTAGVLATALGVGWGMKRHFERATGPRPDDE